tara:strand:+ start:2114 stop:2485 length:372 start_codon:yes stop_codon:yes gene_type:complete
MNLVEIKPLDLIGENEKGRTFGFETLARTGFIFAERKKGSVNGNHYHKGISEGKNPEILLLTSGKIELEVKEVNGNESQKHILDAPLLLEFKPFTIHTVTALTDIQFLEFNSIEEHKADTFYL